MPNYGYIHNTLLKYNSTIFKQQLTNISTVLNNTGNTTQLLASFNALDVAQQKVLLSSKLLTEEQKAQCLTMTTLSSANTKYTAEQLTKATGISAETLATWGLTEATDTLTMSQLAEMASSDAQAKKVLEKIVAQNAQAVANGEVTASNVALTASEGGVTLATGAFTTAIKANIKAMWTWMTTTPIGWLTLLAGGVATVIGLYDLFTTSIEEQKEKMEESLSAYEDAKSELSSVTTELENQEQAMDELLAKEKLTYAEKGQLEELQAITQEFRIQKDLAEKEEGRTKKEVATDASDLFKKQFGKYDISESAINEYQNNTDIIDNNAILISDENDISAMIAGYRRFNELLAEAYGEGNQYNIDHFKSLTDDLKDSIFSTAQDLQQQQDNISDYYNTIKDTPYDDLTTEQKEIVDSYNAISNAIALIYQQLDPNTWNSMQIDNLFATDGIEKTKDELLEMAKEGTLDEKTIQSYSKLNSTLEDSNMVLKDGQSAASALCDEMYALADAEGKVQDSIPSNETDNLSDIFSLKDSKNELTDLGKLNEEIDNFQSAYKGLKEVMDSYNESGEFTLDQVQQIISYGGDYLKYLMDENGNLQLNEEALNKVAVARINEMRVKALSNLMDNLEKITDEESALKYLETQLYDTATAYDDLTASRIKAWSENALENGISQNTIDNVVKNFENQASAINEMFDNINISSISTETTKVSKSTESALDRITNKYKELTDIIGSNVNLIKSQISLLEAQDKEVGGEYYKELINQSATKIDVLNKQFSELRQQFLNTPKGTEEWLELNAAILETQNTIITTKTEMAEYQKTLDNMKWDRLEKEFDALSDTIESNKDIIESHISLLESQDKEIGKGFYEELINDTEKQIDLLNVRQKTLMEQLSTVEEGSEKWIELNKSIFDCQKSIIDAKKSVAEYQKTLDDIQWDRLEEKFESLSDIIESNSSLIQSQISLLETQGSTVGRGYYDELISQTEKKIALLTDRYKTLNEQILTVDEGSDKWIELNQSIFEIQKSLIEAKENIEKFQNSIDELHWNTLNDITDAIKEISDEAGNITDLLNLDDVVDADGNFAQDAITALAMYGEQLESAQYLIKKYSEEMDYLNEEYAKGSITSEEYNEKMKELNELQWDSVDAYNAAKKAIIDLRKNGIEKEIDVLEELYDARKKAWEQEKDQYDWEKTVAENETNKNKLKDQIIELQNDNSLAGIKKRKELEDELAKLESDWEDTLYDHVYDERNDQLDKELEDKKKALENTLTDEEQLVADSIGLVNSHASEVLENLNRLSKQYGIQMSESITKPFEDGENALSRYSEQFSNAQSSFTTQLDNTANNIYAVQKSADDTVLSILNMFMTTNDTLDNQLNITSDKINQAHTDADNAALGFLTMFQSTNGTLDAQLDTTSSKINQLYLDADNASAHIVNMFKTTNGTLLEQLSLVKSAIESVQSAADKAYKSISDMLAEQSKANNDNGVPTLKEIVTSDSWLPSVSEINADKGYQEYKNGSKHTGVPYADISSTNKNEPKQTTTDTKTTTTTTVIKEEKKKTTVSKGGNKVSQVQFGEGYASGTKSATKGLHPTFENGTEIIEKDGMLLVPYDGGEHVFNNEQVQRLWELSKDIKFNMPPNAVKSDYSKLISNINTSARNQSVNVEQKFDALIKVDGDMTPDVLQQIRNDKNIKKDIKNLALEGFVEAYETRGYRIR